MTGLSSQQGEGDGGLSLLCDLKKGAQLVNGAQYTLGVCVLMVYTL